MHSRNTSGLKDHAQMKRSTAIANTEEAIKRLIKEGKTVNFTAVAEAAGVSTSWLYKQPELVERIKHLRSNCHRQRHTVSSPASDTSKNAIIEALRKQVKELRSENQELKQQLESAYGQLEESRYVTYQR